MRWKASKLAKDSSLMTLGMCFRVVAQGLVFIIIARSLGTEGYGSFISIIAISGALSGMVGLGTHVLLTKDVALDSKNFSKAWGNTLLTITFSIPIIFSIYIFLIWLILPNINWLTILFLGFADLVFLPLCNICISAYQGFERIGRASRIIIIPAISRLLAAVLFLYLTTLTLNINLILLWALLYLSASIVAAIFTHKLVFHDIGIPLFANSFSINRIKESLPFSLWAMSDKLYADADKVMLARMTTMDITGTYSAAYRFIDLGLIPLYGLIAAATPHFFKEGHKGIKHSIAYSIKLIKVPILIAVISTILILSFADLVPLILGTAFDNSTKIIYFLAFMPIVVLPRVFMQSILSTINLQKTGMKIILTGSVINILLNLVMIPKWGWYGAVFSTYFAEISMSIGMVSIIYSQLKIQNKLI